LIAIFTLTHNHAFPFLNLAMIFWLSIHENIFYGHPPVSTLLPEIFEIVKSQCFEW
jgi:hypothetical protein